MSKAAKPPERVSLSSETIGRLLFGSYTRMQLGIWIAQLPGAPRCFSQAEYHEWCRESKLMALPATSTLRRFESLNMIRCHPPDKRERRRYYTRLDSPLWGVFLIARDVINVACGESPNWSRPSPSPKKMREAAERLLELREELADG